jgi:hypothetical protein
MVAQPPRSFAAVEAEIWGDVPAADVDPGAGSDERLGSVGQDLQPASLARRRIARVSAS